MDFIATIWIIGLLFLGAAVIGQSIKVRDVELPALTNGFARIALAAVGAVALVLGGVVYLRQPVRESGTALAPAPDKPIAVPNTPEPARESQTVSPLVVKPPMSDIPPINANIVGVWHLNESKGLAVLDSSINANHGTLKGLRPPMRIGGVRGNALRFGGDGYIRVPWSPILEPRFISVQTWVRADASPGQSMYILAKGANECSGASYAFYTGPTGGLYFYVTENGRYNLVSPDAGSQVWDGNWHRITGTYDEVSIRLYVDGKEIGTGTAASFAIGYNLTTSRDLYIGSYQGTCPSTFNGDINEVILWDRPLTPHEIANER